MRKFIKRTAAKIPNHLLTPIGYLTAIIIGIAGAVIFNDVAFQIAWIIINTTVAIQIILNRFDILEKIYLVSTPILVLLFALEFDLAFNLPNYFLLGSFVFCSICVLFRLFLNYPDETIWIAARNRANGGMLAFCFLDFPQLHFALGPFIGILFVSIIRDYITLAQKQHLFYTKASYIFWYAQLLISIVTAIILFGKIYSLQGIETSIGEISNRLWDGIYLSVITWTTLGYGDLTPHTLVGQVFVVIEAILGMSMMALMISSLVIVVQLVNSAEKKEEDEVQRDAEANDA